MSEDEKLILTGGSRLLFETAHVHIATPMRHAYWPVAIEAQTQTGTHVYNDYYNLEVTSQVHTYRHGEIPRHSRYPLRTLHHSEEVGDH